MLIIDVFDEVFRVDKDNRNVFLLLSLFNIKVRVQKTLVLGAVPRSWRV